MSLRFLPLILSQGRRNSKKPYRRFETHMKSFTPLPDAYDHTSPPPDMVEPSEEATNSENQSPLPNKFVNFHGIKFSDHYCGGTMIRRIHSTGRALMVVVHIVIQVRSIRGMCSSSRRGCCGCRSRSRQSRQKRKTRTKNTYAHCACASGATIHAERAYVVCGVCTVGIQCQC